MYDYFQIILNYDDFIMIIQGGVFGECIECSNLGSSRSSSRISLKYKALVTSLIIHKIYPFRTVLSFEQSNQ